jgi:peptidoglycan-associated lipoprotein
MAENFKRVNFEYDSATLTSSSKSYLEENARLMSSNPEIKLTVQGHCDERGSTSYNMALGSRRADTVKKYLIAQGVPASRVSTVSYGEERPLQNDENEVAWAENRRAEFAITWTGSSDNKDYVRGTVD